MPNACPKCGDDGTCRPSKLQPRDWPLLTLLVRPYRCRHCWRRFRRPVWWGRTSAPAAGPVSEGGVGVAAGPPPRGDAAPDAREG